MQWKESIHTGGIEVPQEDKIKSAFPIPCRYLFRIRRQAPRAYWLSVLLGLGMLSFECQMCRKSYIYSPCRTTSKAWFKVSKPTVSPYIKHSIRDALNMLETWSFDHMTCHAEPPWKRPQFPRQALNFWFGTAAAATTGLHTIATWHMEHSWRRSQCIGHVGLIFCISILNYNCTHRCMCWCMRAYIYIYICVCVCADMERERDRESQILWFYQFPPPWPHGYVIERCFRCNQTFSWQGSGISFPARWWFHGYLWINGLFVGQDGLIMMPY